MTHESEDNHLLEDEIPMEVAMTHESEDNHLLAILADEEDGRSDMLEASMRGLYAPSGVCKSDRILQAAKKAGLPIVQIKCTPMTEEDRKGIPQFK